MHYRKSTLLESGVMVFLLALLTGPTLAQEADKKPIDDNLKITISKETTWFTEPLTENGEVDYWQAINTHSAKDVTEENNLAAALIKVIKPGIDDTVGRKKHLKLLGLSDESKFDDRLTSFDNFASDKEGLNAFQAASLLEEFRNGTKDRAKHPLIAQWIEKYSDVVDRYKQELKSKSRIFDPVINTDSKVVQPAEGTEKVFADQSHFQSTSILIQFLTCRSKIYLHENNIDACQSDLIAARKTAILFCSEGAHEQQFFGLLFLRVVNNCEVEFAWHENVTVDQLRSFLEKRRNIRARHMDAYLDLVNVRERVNTLDIATRFKNGDFSPLLSKMPPEVKWQIELPLRAVRKNVDWNQVLLKINSDYNSVVSQLEKATPIEQIDAIRAFNDNRTDEQQDGMLAYIKALASEDPTERNVIVATVCESLGEMNGVDSLLEYHCEFAMLDSLTELNIALQIYNREHGEFPDTIDTLMPNYVTEIPKDTFSNGKLIYKKDGKHFLLYSVGDDRTDDGGDIRIRRTDIGVTSDPKIWRPERN
jgi:hypothetical protein